MSLQRKALERRIELRRTPFDRRKAANKARKPRERDAKARRDTGPTRETRDVLLDRSLGGCEFCGRQLWVYPRGWIGPHAVHHRQPRQMGGSSRAEINSPANLLLICDGRPDACHPWIESNRAKAYEMGLLVRASADPAQVPVTLEGGDQYLLTDAGGRELVAT